MLPMAERAKYASSKYSPTDKAWVQFVRDHRAYLLASSLLINITDEQMNVYKFRPIAFLTEQGVPKEHIWIIFWLNNIDPLKFEGVTTLKAPPQNLLASLYAQYKVGTNAATPTTVRTTVGI